MIKCLINKSEKSVIGAVLFDKNVDDLFYSIGTNFLSSFRDFKSLYLLS